MVAMVAMVLATAAPAFAVNKQCGSRPCEGTNNPDVLFERGGDGINDVIYGLRGGDRINADRFRDDIDKLFGGRGGDTLNADDGDTLDGGAGTDVCSGDAGDTFVDCETVFIDGVEQVPAA
ncbi:MAG: hypothetical protein M3N18_11570 [Actinomycetota bacterium]|nr:hypothetical protein [Actinomycetota bacterium]